MSPTHFVSNIRHQHRCDLIKCTCKSYATNESRLFKKKYQTIHWVVPLYNDAIYWNIFKCRKWKNCSDPLCDEILNFDGNWVIKNDTWIFANSPLFSKKFPLTLGVNKLVLEWDWKWELKMRKVFIPFQMGGFCLFQMKQAERPAWCAVILQKQNAFLVSTILFKLLFICQCPREVRRKL